MLFFSLDGSTHSAKQCQGRAMVLRVQQQQQQQQQQIFQIICYQL